jgi:hypothetical protein
LVGQAGDAGRVHSADQRIGQLLVNNGRHDWPIIGQSRESPWALPNAGAAVSDFNDAARPSFDARARLLRNRRSASARMNQKQAGAPCLLTVVTTPPLLARPETRQRW